MYLGNRNRSSFYMLIAMFGNIKILYKIYDALRKKLFLNKHYSIYFCKNNFLGKRLSPCL